MKNLQDREAPSTGHDGRTFFIIEKYVIAPVLGYIRSGIGCIIEWFRESGAIFHVLEEYINTDVYVSRGL